MKTTLHIHQPDVIRAGGGLDAAIGLGVALGERLSPLQLDHEIGLTIRPPDGSEPKWAERTDPCFSFAANRSIDSRTVVGMFYLDGNVGVVGRILGSPALIVNGPTDKVLDAICQRLVQNLVYPHGLPATVGAIPGQTA